MGKKEQSTTLTGLGLMGSWSIITKMGERIDGKTQGVFDNALILETDEKETVIIFLDFIAMLWERKSEEKPTETEEAGKV